MESGPAGNLHIWHASASPLAQDLLEGENGLEGGRQEQPAEVAHRLYACESLKAHAARSTEAAEPYSLQWFLDIEALRHSRQGRWIPRLLEFAKHPGETLLGLGHGLGTDWLQYARHGASVVVCSPSSEQLGLIRRNFELRGLSGRFLHSDFEPLPLETSSIDVACVSSLLQEVGHPDRLIEEVYRVLRPGGKVLVVTPAKYDADFWFHVSFPWLRWLFGASKAAGQPPLRFSARRLRRLFGQFTEHKIHKRHLRRSEVPHVWRWLPMPLLERLMGRVLVLKAFKPLSAALPLAVAA